MMAQVVFWKGLIALVGPRYPEGARPASPLLTMLPVHLQKWFSHSDSAVEETVCETTILCQSGELSLERSPDETMNLTFHRQPEMHDLAAGVLGMLTGYQDDCGLSLCQDTIMEVTLIQSLSSVTSGLVHSAVITAAHVADVAQVGILLYGRGEKIMRAEADYSGGEKREEHAGRRIIWQAGSGAVPTKNLASRGLSKKAICRFRKVKAQARLSAEHLVRVSKRQFGYVCEIGNACCGRLWRQKPKWAKTLIVTCFLALKSTVLGGGQNYRGCFRSTITNRCNNVPDALLRKISSFYAIPLSYPFTGTLAATSRSRCYFA